MGRELEILLRFEPHIYMSHSHFSYHLPPVCLEEERQKIYQGGREEVLKTQTGFQHIVISLPN
ncbi:hypothetical protein YC2023_079633 [Brassica napus]